MSVLRYGGMNLSLRKEQDLETIKYFMPEFMKTIPISDEDVERFFEYSERGLHKHLLSTGLGIHHQDGFNALCEGKRWRGIHMQMYEEGVLDGSTPYNILVEGAPKSVIDFMAKEMFKGKDKELILKCASES